MPDARAGVANFLQFPKGGAPLRHALAVVTALLPVLAWSNPERADARFDKLRSAAESVGGLGSFLERYVGSDCASRAMGGGECLDNAASFRKKATGKRFFLTVDDTAGLVSMAERGETDFTLNLTPFFGAAGSAVTHGAPSRTDAHGNPVLPYLRVSGKAPEGNDADWVNRVINMRGLRFEVVFTPQGVWQVAKKGGGKVSGVKARVEALRVVIARTGEAIATWYPR